MREMGKFNPNDNELTKIWLHSNSITDKPIEQYKNMAIAKWLIFMSTEIPGKGV